MMHPEVGDIESGQLGTVKFCDCTMAPPGLPIAPTRVVVLKSGPWHAAWSRVSYVKKETGNPPGEGNALNTPSLKKKASLAGTASNVAPSTSGAVKHVMAELV